MNKVLIGLYSLANKMHKLHVMLVALLGYFLLGLFSPAYAQLTYPISELGYCRDAKECYLYCEIPTNKPACWSYGTYKLSPNVLAETSESPEEKAKRLGITFPIAELGNCANIEACIDYCNEAQNHQTCMDFARRKGLHEEPPSDAPPVDKNRLLKEATRELGCNSENTCRAYCEQPQNHQRCMEFAQRQGLGEASSQTATPGVPKEDLLRNAASELGCSSREACQSFCENPVNHERCMEFGRRHGVDEGGQQGSPPVGGQKPGGCDSEESCRKYCQENPSECQGYSGQTGGPSYTGPHPTPGAYLGPSGCKTEEECKAYCQANPSQCPGFQQQPQPTYGAYPTYQPYPTSYPQPTPPAGGYPAPTSYEQPQSYPTYTPQTTTESGSSGTYQYPQPTP